LGKIIFMVKFLAVFKHRWLFGEIGDRLASFDLVKVLAPGRPSGSNIEVEGITDFYINETEKIIVIKFDKEKVDEKYIKDFLKKAD